MQVLSQCFKFGYLAFLYNFILERTMYVLVTFYQRGHFVMLIISHASSLTNAFVDISRFPLEFHLENQRHKQINKQTKEPLLIMIIFRH